MELLRLRESGHTSNTYVKENEIHVYVQESTINNVKAAKIIIKHGNWRIEVGLSDPEGYIKGGLAFKLDLHNFLALCEIVQKSNHDGWMVICRPSVVRNLYGNTR